MHRTTSIRPDTQLSQSPVPRSGDRLESVEGIILAGEYHWTGSLFEELRPRPLLPVAQTALVEHVLSWMCQGGVHDTTICANGSTPALRNYLKDGRQFSMDLFYYEDGTPRGAAGCVKDAAVRSDAQTLIVADGASIPVVDLSELVAQHRRTGAALTIVAHRRESRSDGTPLLHPAGVYVFEREILEAIPAISFQDIKENLIPKLHRDGHRVEVYPVAELSPRVLNADSYLAINHWMITRLTFAAASNDSATNGRWRELIADASAWVDPDAMILGPVILGPGVRVYGGATIVGPTSIGAGTTIGPSAVVTRSVTWNNCVIGERAIVDRCVVADDGAVAPGSALSSAIRTSKPTHG
jgi:NDP-sugar pyrophosphorylase family protein